MVRTTGGSAVEARTRRRPPHLPVRAYELLGLPGFSPPESWTGVHEIHG